VALLVTLALFTVVGVVLVAAMFRAGLSLAAIAIIARAALMPTAHGAAVVATTTSTRTDSTTTTIPTAATTTTATTTTTTTAPPASRRSPTTMATRATKAGLRHTPPSTATSTGRRLSAVSQGSRVEQVEAIADESGWNWRSAGVVIHVRYHPDDCCHWGIYDTRDTSLWIGPSAFASTTRLRYVVLHELGHAWQWHSGHLDSLAADMAPWGHRRRNGLEAGADCISVVWGASARAGHYWSCPSPAAALVARRLTGDWR
jgi:hypothetical protein